MSTERTWQEPAPRTPSRRAIPYQRAALRLVRPNAGVAVPPGRAQTRTHCRHSGPDHHAARHAATDAGAAALVAAPFLDPVEAIAFVAAWLIAVAVTRGYEWHLPTHGIEDTHRLGRAGIGLAIGGAALVAPAFPSMSAVAWIWLTGAAATLSWSGRQLDRLLGRVLGRPVARVLVAGPEDAVADLVDDLRRARCELAGVCVPERSSLVPDPGVELIVGMDDLAARAEAIGVDAVIALPCPGLRADRLRRTSWALGERGIQLLVCPGLIGVETHRATLAPVGDAPLLHVRAPEVRGARRFAEDVVHRILATMALALALPVILAIAAAVRLDSAGPAFYRQVRLGRDGVPFVMWKFRTMVLDADRRRAALEPATDADGPLFKLRSDPRVTRLGGFLRRYSLDELPQLLNVARGDMALVGPRPPLPSEVSRYDDTARRRLVVKPGLTGLWQVSGRSDLSWAESVRLDLHYVDNWSLALDLRILLRTIRAVLGHTGAY